MNGLLTKLRRRAPFFVTILCLAVIVGFIVYDAQARNASPPVASPSPTQGSATEENGDYAHVGWKVRMISGLDVTLT